MLDEVLAAWEERVEALAGGTLGELTGLLRQSASGGKMLRGALVKLGYELAGGGDDDARIYAAAAAYELLHAGLLIHDDIMDHARLRRGRPAVHVAAGGGHYGLSQAICLGDAAIFLAHQQLTGAGFEAGPTAAALARFSQVSADTAAGQMLDLALSRPGARRAESDIMRMYELKTAAYTVTGPLTVGAMLGGAGPQQLEAIGRYGRLAGTAFQIQDDILGVFAGEAATGKFPGSDIAENKNTLLIAYAAEHAQPPDREILDQIYGRPGINPGQLAQIRQLFKSGGALDYARSSAQEAAAAASAAAQHITKDAGRRELLEQLAVFTVSRAS